jgi:hypothetical protein
VKDAVMPVGGGGKRTFDATALDVVERQRQFANNHTLRNQGNRSPFDLRLEEISHHNTVLSTNLPGKRHLVVRSHFDDSHSISLASLKQVRQ